MTTPSRPSFLSRLIGLPATDAQDDAGDMGTAIGLEYSLDQAALHAAPGPAGGAAARGEGSARSGWFSRRTSND